MTSGCSETGNWKYQRREIYIKKKCYLTPVLTINYRQRKIKSSILTYRAFYQMVHLNFSIIYRIFY